jgi:hypothetical protein
MRYPSMIFKRGDEDLEAMILMSWKAGIAKAANGEARGVLDLRHSPDLTLEPVKREKFVSLKSFSRAVF